MAKDGVSDAESISWRLAPKFLLTRPRSRTDGLVCALRLHVFFLSPGLGGSDCLRVGVWWGSNNTSRVTHKFYSILQAAFSSNAVFYACGTRPLPSALVRPYVHFRDLF